MFPKKKRVKNRKLLDSYREKRCLIDQGCMGVVCAHHITSVGAGGGDSVDNLLPVCAKHHNEIHMSQIKFMEKYPIYIRFLRALDRFDVIEKLYSK